MTTTVNPTLTTLENVFKTIVWDPLFAAGQTALIAAVPFLGAPIISTIEGEGEKILSSTLFSWFVQFVDVEYLELKDAAMQAAYSAASVKLLALAAQNGTDNEAYQQALQTEAISFSQFVRFNQ